MVPDQYLKIADHYRGRLAAHGDTAKGADWPNQRERDVRHDVMLSVLDRYGQEGLTLLDFACGTGDLLRHITATRRDNVRYKGADISPTAVAMARQKFSNADFLEIDILAADEAALSALACDVCVINGLFTVKHTLTHDEMWSFVNAVVRKLWPVTRKAIAFNVMSFHVDRQRDDLFHLSYDQAAQFLHELSGRQIAFRADYGLYEYTCIGFKETPPTTHLTPRRPEHLKTRDERQPPDQTKSVEVCRPLLPVAKSISPYLDSIDHRRWYSNWGQLNGELESRLARLLRQPAHTVVTASTGTDAITAALIAVVGRARSKEQICIVPSYTFVGTAAAVMNAGYTPYFVDIDADTMAINPDRLCTNPVLSRASAVIVVAPYGQPVDTKKWRHLSDVSGVPIFIDAAAGFDAVATGALSLESGIPLILSFHATKPLSTAEGGAILCAIPELAVSCKRTLNFGFLGDRVATVAGINGKLSEYHAAIGLGELDAWPAKRNAFISVAESYTAAAEQSGIGKFIVAERDWASSYVLFRASESDMARRVERALDQARISHRLWYGSGLHRHPGYASCPSDDLPVTDDIAARVVGLPVSVDLSQADIVHVVSTIAAALGNPDTPLSSVA